MTFLELTQVCVDDFGKSDGEWISRFKRFLNRAQREIANKRRWPFLITFDSTFPTVAATDSYTLTETNIEQLLSMRITTVGYERDLEPMFYTPFRQVYPSVSSTNNPGTPSSYYTVGRTSTNQLKVRLFAVPDAVYTVAYDYYMTPATMTTDSDVPTIPPVYHDLLTDYALWKSHEHLRQSDQATVFQSSFESRLRQMMGNYNFPATAEPMSASYAGQDAE